MKKRRKVTKSKVLLAMERERMLRAVSEQRRAIAGRGSLTE